MRSSPPSDASTIIVGGGISGASTLHWLASRGSDVVLLEAAAKLGGVIGSARTTSGALVETGPISTQLNSPSLSRLIDELSLRDEILVADQRAKKRFIVRDGRLAATPTNLWDAVQSPLLSVAAKLRLMREPWVSSCANASDESIADFVERRLGREVLDYLINPFVSGVYAGRPEDLSMRHSFPALYALERENGSVFRGVLARRRDAKGSRRANTVVSFRDGMATLPLRIESRWRERIHLNTSVETIERHGGRWRVSTAAASYDADHLVLATSAPVASALVDNLDSSLAQALKRVCYTPVTTVLSVYARTAVAHLLDGFGCLMPEIERRRVLGILFNSSLFPHHAPAETVALTSFVGGARDPHAAALSDEAIESLVRQEHVALLGVDSAPIETVINRWSEAIPQYLLDYDEILKAIADGESRHSGLYLVGNYRGGVSVGDCIQSALDVADKINEPPVTA